MVPPVPRDAVPGYELLQLLGRGGMGEVWRARDLALGREVAIKLLAQTSPVALTRFQREAQLAAAVDDHAGIVRVHSTGVSAQGRPFLICELVPGARSLEAAFQGAPLRQRVEWVAAAAEALGAAHARGIVHRDVKPDNLLVDAAGLLRVADFGLATAVDLERLTQTGAIVGTPAFLSPEQIVGGAPLGPHVDVWALGCVLYLALTGQLPFEAGSFLELASRVTRGRYEPVRALDPSVPAALEAACARALSKRPADRHADGAALAAELRAWLEGRAWTAWRPAGRGRRLALATIALLAIGGAGVAVSLGPPGGAAPGTSRASGREDGSLDGLLAALAGLDSATLLRHVDDPLPARAAAARIVLARAVRAADPQAALELLAPLEPRHRAAEEQLPRLFLRMDAGEAVDPIPLPPETRVALQERARARLSGAIEAGDMQAVLGALSGLREAGRDAIPAPALDRLLSLLHQRLPRRSDFRIDAGGPEVVRILHACSQTGARAGRGPGAERLAAGLESLPLGGTFLGGKEAAPWEWLEAAYALDLDFDLRYRIPGHVSPPGGLPLCAGLKRWCVASEERRAPPRDFLAALGPIQGARLILWSGGDVREAQRLDPDGPAVLLALAIDEGGRVGRASSVAALDRLVQLLKPLTSVGTADPAALARAHGTKRVLHLQSVSLEGALQRVRSEQPLFGRALAEGFLAAGVLDRVDPLERSPARVR